MVCMQIVIDVGDIPHCFNPYVPGLEFLHHFLHEGQQTIRTISPCQSIVDFSSCRYKYHLDLPPGFGFMSHI